MVPGNDDKHFCKPTDVAVSSKTGEIFVADGYCNSRIMKFDAKGKFLGSFGNMNTDQEQPKNGELFVPHSLALIEDLNLLCVADRENQRIQCFTAGLSPKGAHQRAVSPTGTFVTKAQNIGRVMAIREKRKSTLVILPAVVKTINRLRMDQAKSFVSFTIITFVLISSRCSVYGARLKNVYFGSEFP